MKVTITEKGVHDQKGERIPVGTTLTIKGDKMPAYLVGKAAAMGVEPVTNPAKTKKRQALEAQADKLSLEYSEETSDDDLIEAIKAAKV